MTQIKPYLCAPKLWRARSYHYGQAEISSPTFWGLICNGVDYCVDYFISLSYMALSLLPCPCDDVPIPPCLTIPYVNIDLLIHYL